MVKEAPNIPAGNHLLAEKIEQFRQTGKLDSALHEHVHTCRACQANLAAVREPQSGDDVLYDAELYALCKRLAVAARGFLIKRN